MIPKVERLGQIQAATEEDKIQPNAGDLALIEMPSRWSTGNTAFLRTFVGPTPRRLVVAIYISGSSRWRYLQTS
jgi:hypothetical protein